MKRKLITLIFLFIIGYIGNIAYATDYYVIATGTNGSGASWTDALVGTAGLKTAITNAVDGDVVNVAAGTYKLTSAADYFSLKKGIKILGGYPAAGGNSRDRDANPTILNGLYAGTSRSQQAVLGTGDISGGLYDGFIIEQAGTGTGGGVYLQNITNAGTEPVLNNLLIRDCRGTNGAGLAISNATMNTTPIKATNIAISSCAVTGNGGGVYINNVMVELDGISVQSSSSAYYGGGMYITSAKINQFDNVVIDGNTSAGAGGGAYIISTSTATMKNITVKNNQSTAASGGGLYIYGSIVGFDNISILNNYAAYAGGGLYFDGSTSTGSSFKINNALVQNNTAITDGGGIYLTTLNKSYAKNPILTSIRVLDNKAGGNGGGIVTTSVWDVYVEYAVVTGNIAGYGKSCASTSGNGGGVYNTTSKGNIGGIFRNVTFSNNTAQNSGGGMYNTTATIDIVNFCMNNNKASNGGGIVNTSSDGGSNIENGVILVGNNGMINNNVAHGGIGSSYGYGGGMYNSTTALTMTNVEIANNYATNQGGGMWNTSCHWQRFYDLLIADNFSARAGGGIYNTTCHNVLSVLGATYTLYDGTPPRYINCTVAGNYAAGTNAEGSGGGIYNTTTSLTLQNCVVYNNYGNTSNNGPLNSDYVINQRTSTAAQSTSRANYTLFGTIEFYAGMNALTMDATSASLYGVNPLFIGQAPANLLSTSSFSSGTGSNCQETMANGVVNRNPAYFSGNYHLRSGSICIDKGNNDYIFWTNDLDLKDRLQGTNVDLGTYEGIGGNRDFVCFGCALGTCIEIICPPVVIWTPEPGETDWNNPNNWRPQLVPGPCTTVYIPGDVATFPYLYPAPGDEVNVCDKIIFLQGGEVGHQDLLIYNKAYIQYNMSHNAYAPNPTAEATILETEADPVNDGKAKPININDHLELSADESKSNISRNQWHMLSAPIKEAVSGDFSFGGYPRTFMRRFIVQPDGSCPVGQFTEPFATENVPLKAGEGFAYWMNEYRNGQELYMEYGAGDEPDVADLSAAAFDVGQREFGIKMSNGIIQLPYFYDNTLVMSRRIASHSSVNNTTTFHYYWSDRPGLPADIIKKDTYARTNAAYRLYDSPVTYSVNSGVSQGFLLIGNPFMSTIDFQKFYMDNSAFLDPSYKLYDPVSKTYFEYTFSPEVVIGDIDRYIAPLQGFFVQLKQGVSAADLIFNINDISIKRPQTTLSTLRLSTTESGEKNVIRINAVNEYSSSQAIVAKRENAGGAYNPDMDVSKLFSNNGGVPDVFTLSDGYPLAMNFIGNEAITIPVGIHTQATVDTKLQLEGMDRYDAKQILFIDNKSGMKYDLTGKASFEYPFTNTVSGVLNDRFFLQISKSPTSMEDVLDYSRLINIYLSDNKIIITSSADNPVQQVYLYNTQGVLLQSETPSGSTCVALNGNLPKNSLVIAKVVTEKLTKTAKIVYK